MLWFAYSSFAHCWSLPTLLLDGSSKTIPLLEKCSFLHKSCHWSQFSSLLPGTSFTSSSSTRKIHSTLAWVISQRTLTPSNQRRPGSLPCSPRLLSLWLLSPTSSALPLLTNKVCNTKVSLGLTQMLQKRKPPFLRKNPKPKKLPPPVMPLQKTMLPPQNERRHDL